MLGQIVEGSLVLYPKGAYPRYLLQPTSISEISSVSEIDNAYRRNYLSPSSVSEILSHFCYIIFFTPVAHDRSSGQGYHRTRTVIHRAVDGKNGCEKTNLAQRKSRGAATKGEGVASEAV